MSYSYKMSPSTNLFRSPSFMKGVARTFDLLGALDEYQYDKSGSKADLKALRRDWKIIGQEMFHAINKYYDQKINEANKTISK